MADERVSRRTFVRRTAAAIGAVALGELTTAQTGHGAQVIPPIRGSLPDTPYRIGQMTTLTGVGAPLGAPMLSGHLLAAEEINAHGGLLGRRRIATVSVDEGAGALASFAELRRLKRAARIDAFAGVAASLNATALAPVAEEFKILTLLVDGATDTLFESVVPRAKYVFRVSNLQSADGVACAVTVAKVWPDIRRITFLNPDYAYGRNVFEHFHVAIKKLLPGAAILAEVLAPLGLRDFAPLLTRTDALKPDLVVTALWGDDYRIFYRQAMSAGLFRRTRVATTVAFGVAPHTIETDHPEGVLAGARSGYHWNLASGSGAASEGFVRRYYARWKEYPNYAAEGAYTALHLLRVAIERANQTVGGWPDDEAIIKHLEGLTWEAPGGRIAIRPDNHQGYRDVVMGFTHHDTRYPFTVLDPRRVIKIPISSITAPPGWPAGPPSATYRWIDKTWPVTR
jgi:branched-chain amino acid transport system substrate-binding protein